MSSYGKSSRSIPTVIFNNCNELELLIRDWLGNDRIPNESMGLLMFKLGILNDENDVSELFSFNKEDCSFNCIINGCDVYNMKFKNLNVVGFNPEIEFSIGNVRYTYLCIPIENIELGMRVIKKSYSVYENRVCYTRYMSLENALFTIDNGKYILEFGVSKPNEVGLSLFDGCGNYSKYELDNEDEVVKYLIGLKKQISLVDVYKDICRISLGDICNYPRVLLKVSKRDMFGNRRITDLIHLENGRLERFGMTGLDTDRMVLIDKDGNWFYEMNRDDTFVKISSGGTDKINYNICVSNNDSLNDVKLLVESNIDNANEDVNSIKKMVKKIF